MNGGQGIWPIVWERFAANWRLLSVLALGFIVAATLLAVSPIYTRVMNDLGLEHSLKTNLRSARTTVTAIGLPLGSDAAAEESRAIAAMMDDEIGWFTGSERRGMTVDNLTVGFEGEPIETGVLRRLLEIHAFSGLADHVRIVEGRLPETTDDPAVIEVIMPRAAAEELEVHPGDRILAAHIYDDCDRPPPTEDPAQLAEQRLHRCTPQLTVTLRVPLTVVGSFDPVDAADPFWGGSRITFTAPRYFMVSETESEPPVFPVVMTEETFQGALAQAMPSIPATFQVSSFADIDRLDSTNIDRVRADLATLKTRALERGDIADLRLAEELADFRTRASFNQVSLLLLLLQVVGIALYYVVLVAGMLVERRSEEIAMLRSRGASTWQIVGTSLIEGSVLAVVAVLIAPALAATIVALLGLTPTFDGIGNGGLLPFQAVPSAFAFAAVGALLALFALLLPTYVTARKAMVGYLRSSARPEKPFVQRYFIDIGLAALAGLLLWELNQRGSVYDPNSVGGWSADPMLVLSPILLIVAIGALLFRLLPIVTGLISRLLSLTMGAGTAIGLWQLSRNPSRYIQLALLVVMAAAVGTFAATYSTTTDRSQEERALFEAGSDLRLEELGTLQNRRAAALEETLLAIDGVEAVAPAYRDEMRLGPVEGRGDAVTVLGIDPARFQEVAWFRDDFADAPLDDLMVQISGSTATSSGIQLPGTPASVTVWVNPSQARPGTRMWLRSVDARGIFHYDQLGILDFQGFRPLTAQVEIDGPDSLPLSIVAITFSAPNGGREAQVDTVVIDDITVRDVSGAETVVEDFEGPFRWQTLRTATQTRDTFEQSSDGREGGSGRYTFLVGTSLSNRGAYVDDPDLPIPAIASRSLLARTGAVVGSEIEVVVGTIAMPVRIEASASLFPTIPDQGSGFLIINQEHLFFFSQLANQRVAQRPTEAWLQLTADPAVRSTALTEILDLANLHPGTYTDRAALLEEVRSDPVVRAGGSGVLFVSLVAAMLLLALGFSLTLYTGGQARTVELSVMRAMGFSRAQVFVMVGLEYLIVAVVGLVAGTLAGLQISRTMLSFLNVTEEGDTLVPPFALDTEWGAVAVAFTAVGLTFVAGICALGVYFLRLQVSRILRLTR